MGDLERERFLKCSQPGRKVVEVQVTFGASTAISSWDGDGVTAVAKDATGIVQFTFAKAFEALKGVYVSRQGATGTANLFPIVTSNAIDTTGIVKVALTSEAGTATDPTDGNVYWFQFVIDTLGL